MKSVVQMRGNIIAMCLMMFGEVAAIQTESAMTAYRTLTMQVIEATNAPAERFGTKGHAIHTAKRSKLMTNGSRMRSVLITKSVNGFIGFKPQPIICCVNCNGVESGFANGAVKMASKHLTPNLWAGGEKL